MEISKAHTDPNSLKLISRWYTPCRFTTKTKDIREARRKDRDIKEAHTRSYRNTEISRRYWYTSSPRKKHKLRYQGDTYSFLQTLIFQRGTH